MDSSGRPPLLETSKTSAPPTESTSPAHHQVSPAKAPVTLYLAPARHTGCTVFRTAATQPHPAATGTSTLARLPSILEMDSPPLRPRTYATISTGQQTIPLLEVAKGGNPRSPKLLPPTTVDHDAHVDLRISKLRHRNSVFPRHSNIVTW